MMKPADSHLVQCEQILADAMQGVASELRLVDPAEYVAFFRAEHLGNLANLVNSSTELYFLPGAVAFAMSGDVRTGWDRTPTVFLDMHFRHNDVSAYFRLMLDSREAGIEMTFIDFKRPQNDADMNTRCLAEALAQATLAGLHDATADQARCPRGR